MGQGQGAVTWTEIFLLISPHRAQPSVKHPFLVFLILHPCPYTSHRIRPIDKRLQYQIERLIKAAQIAKRQDAQLKGGKGGKGEALDQDDVVEDEDEGDATRFGPRREMLGAKGASAAPGGGKTGRSGSSAAEDGKPGIYRPPKINPVSMEE